MQYMVFLDVRMTKTRNRSYSKSSFDERLTQAARNARSTAAQLEPGPEQEKLLAKARQFETQVRMNKILKS